MTQDVFYSKLNEFCRKYLVSNVEVSVTDQQNFSTNIETLKKDLFEHFLLFDSVHFKVYGENILVPLLIRFFGEKGFRSLIEQGAIRFVLWNPMVGHVVQNIAGLDPLVHGNINSPAHSDPEQSIELGLNWMENKPSPRDRKRLTKLILPLYSLPSPSLSSNAINIVRSAFKSGRLIHYGLDPALKQFDSLPLPDRELLTTCATEFLEYNFLLDNNLTSFSDYKFYSPFWDSVNKFTVPTKMQDGFGKIAALEGVPNIQALYDEIQNPLSKLHNIRNNRNAVKFRRWLESAVTNGPEPGIAKSYIDSIAERKGAFDATPQRFVKSIALATLGAGSGFILGEVLGGALGGMIGTAGGGVISASAPFIAQKALEFSGELGTDLLDSFLLERVSKGWSPRMFFNDLERLRKAKKLS